MTAARRVPSKPLPQEFLEWQVELRALTMDRHRGAPRSGVAPLLTVARPGATLGVSTHSIICGLLARPDRLEEKTAEFRALYERHAPDGSRALYDHGIEYLRGYYRDAAEFDRHSITTLLPGDSDLVRALEAEPRCRLLFYVFDLEERSNTGRFRCLEMEATAEALRDGPVFDNVWWHNTLFHGKADGAVVVRFHHQATYDAGWGRYEKLD